MNLIDDRWIPIRRADGSTDKIAPWEITQDIHDEKRKIIAVASPRPDFDGALTQFLIGLLQTACTPETDDAWWDWREKPPQIETLKRCFNPLITTFAFDGEVPRFMQDFLPNELTTDRGIAALLIEYPGENTLDQNIDHFIKRDTVDKICSSCAASALFTLQVNGPSEGAGYRTGIRGGGPLTTLVLGNSLWETTWLNVLVKSRYVCKGFKNVEGNSPYRFPWLAPTRTSNPKSGGINTYLSDIHPDQLFWAMPKRINLFYRDFNNELICDLCGESATRLYYSYQMKNHGINYEGAFEHPLTPYTVKNNEFIPHHPKPGGIVYRYWLNFLTKYTDGDNEKIPAKVVEQFYSIARNDNEDRLWAFGYDIVGGQAKARCWYDAKVPILLIDVKLKELFSGNVDRLIKSAELTAEKLKKQIKATLFRDTGKKANLGFVENLFWRQTEPGFYQSAYQIREVLLKDHNETQIMLNWREMLSHAALKIFDTHAQAGDFDAVNPGRVARARNELSGIIYGDKLKGILGLPKDKSKKKKR